MKPVEIEKIVGDPEKTDSWVVRVGDGPGKLWIIGEYESSKHGVKRTIKIPQLESKGT